MCRRSRPTWQYKLVVFVFVIATSIGGLGFVSSAHTEGLIPTATWVNGEGSGGGG